MSTYVNHGILLVFPVFFFDKLISLRLHCAVLQLPAPRGAPLVAPGSENGTPAHLQRYHRIPQGQFNGVGGHLPPKVRN